MCGISGFVSLDRSVSTIDYVRGHATLAHRGPDDNGIVYLSPEYKLSCKLNKDSSGNFWNEVLNDLPNGKALLGHHRLSILDLSDHGHQPMRHENYTLLFNGEIYNYVELREELISLGQKFITDSDTEVLLKAWAQWGEKALAKLNGMWAFCIYDEVNERLVLSRDRFGEKPLYWAKQKQTIYFASELKFFKSLIPLRLNVLLANDYLVNCQIDHTDQTLFSDIYQVKPGALLTFDLSNLKYKETRYWDLSKYSVEAKRSFEETCAEFLQLLESAVSIRLRSDVPVGVMLSGGLDSNAIAGVLNYMVSEKNINSYSAIFEDKRFSEREYIELALDKNQKLKNTYISYGPEEALEQLPHLLWIQDHPVRSLAVFSQYRLHQKIRSDNHVGVVLSGQGADELFAGYAQYNNYYLAASLLQSEYHRFVSELSALHYNDNISIAKIFWNLTKIFFSLSRNKSIGEVASDGLYFWQKDQLFVSALPEYLRYEDRNSMAASVESRIPFLDHRIAEFAMTIPDAFKIDKGVRKKIMRTALQNIVPKQIINDRVKKGFISPQLAWQEVGPLNKWLINNFELPQFLDKSAKNLTDPWFKWRVACFNQWRSVFDV